MFELLRQFMGSLMAFCFITAYIPQIIKIIKTKQVRDISLGMFAITAIGYSSGLIYMFMTHFAIWLFLNYALGLFMLLILGILYLRFSPK